MDTHCTNAFVVRADATIKELAEQASCMAGTVASIISSNVSCIEGAQVQASMFGALYLAESVEKMLEAIEDRIAKGEVRHD
ncbi:hypothetical protein ACWKWK_15605 [Pseudoxanthomonas beigongshangi]